MRHLNPYEQTQLARYGQKKGTSLTDSIPIEYVTGVAEFCGLPFFVSEAVLIPRIETEQLVDLVAQKVEELFVIQNFTPQHQMTIVEVGAGSGAVSIALAKRCAAHAESLSLYATDISPDALDVLRQNMHTLLTPADCTVTILESDLLQHSALPSNISILVANLPYIPSARLPILDAGVRDHEPHLALDGGPDGFSLIRHLLVDALPRLDSESHVFLEVDDTHTTDFIEKQPEIANNYRYTCINDLNEINRFVYLQRIYQSLVG